MDSILLVDGNALLYRAYHAFPKELSTPTGEQIGAVYGFTRILLSTLKTLKPTSLAVCFDVKGPTFRHKKYDDYKATRQKMPEELANQIERMYQIVEHMECPIYTAQGYEADDVIGTIAQQATKDNNACKVIVLTGDQDILQLVDERIFVYTPGTALKGPTLFDPAKVQEKYGFAPLQMIEYKALRGDPSDNIPGVPGIGEVTASKLLEQFGDIKHLYEEIKKGTTEGIKPAVLQKLLENEDSAWLSHDLATIRTDAPVQFDPKAAQLALMHPEKLITLFKELGFKSLLRELPTSHRLISEAADVFTETPTEEEAPVMPLSESEKVDLKIAPILRAMETRGVKVDSVYLQDLEKEYLAELDKMRATLNELAGEEFNPDSPAQVAHILYEVLSISTKNVRKGKTGYTTDASTLQELAGEYPIAKLLLAYRERNKLLTTYIKPLQELVDSKHRIHTSYAPDTSTGRISSRNPNLQNIPIRSEEGRRLRKAFIPQKGWVLLAADYSQIELRIAAHLADDPVMKKIFQEGRDFHSETAEHMQVDRRTAKIINFSILYGKGAFGFAQDLGISVAEAKEYIEQYFKTFHRLRIYLDSLLENARTNGYAETLFGRRKAYPDLTASNFIRRSAAEREAVNFPIQGSGADILKLAMWKLQQTLEKSSTKAEMILTVHDELVLEVPEKELLEAAKLLHTCMTTATELSVPLEVHVKSGNNWAEMAEIPLTELNVTSPE